MAVNMKRKDVTKANSIQILQRNWINFLLEENISHVNNWSNMLKGEKKIQTHFSEMFVAINKIQKVI